MSTHGESDVAAGARVEGRVLRADARVASVEILSGAERGKVRTCALRGRLFDDRGEERNPICAGDFVLLDFDASAVDNLPGIASVLPRRNWLARVASSHDPRAQVLFANVDALYVIASVSAPRFSSNRADRILAACRWHSIPALLVLNKVDLAQPGDAEMLRETYSRAGVELLETCALDGRGLPDLRERLRGKVSAFYGGSGVGKSSLLNALDPQLALKVGRISRFWEQGKHTTSSSQLHELSFGAWVIDTPGIRVFRLHGIGVAQLRGLFPEIDALAARCHFPDCSHDHEPQCAVFDAVDRGQLAPTRLASYLELVDELRGTRAPDVPEAPAGLESED